MTSAPEPPKKASWYYSVWFVIAMLTPLALGPLALPLLWKSPQFSQRAKLVWTLITLAWTAALIVYVCKYLLPMLTDQLNQQLNIGL